MSNYKSWCPSPTQKQGSCAPASPSPRTRRISSGPRTRRKSSGPRIRRRSSSWQTISCLSQKRDLLALCGEMTARCMLERFADKIRQEENAPGGTKYILGGMATQVQLRPSCSKRFKRAHHQPPTQAPFLKRLVREAVRPVAPSSLVRAWHQGQWHIDRH